jgi:large subunit ribosomal protein L25
MSVIQLNGTRRDRLGKGGARKARAAGQIPGVVYGHGEAPVPVAVGARDFTNALRGHKGGNPIVNLNVDGGEVTALIRDVQYDPLTSAILHLDFQHISLTEMVEVEVPVHLVGVPTGVKDGGGILEHLIRTIEVRCLPTAIPASIDLDVTGLVVGASAHVSDLKVEGIEILTDPGATLAIVAAPTVEAEPTPADAAAAVAPTAAEPEVVGAKGKKEESAEAPKK